MRAIIGLQYEPLPGIAALITTEEGRNDQAHDYPRTFSRLLAPAQGTVATRLADAAGVA